MAKFKDLGDVMQIAQDSYGLEEAYVSSHIVGKDRGKMLRLDYEGTGDAAKIIEGLVKALGEPVSELTESSDGSFNKEFTDDTSYVKIFFNRTAKEGKQSIQLKGATTNLLIYNVIKSLASSLIQTEKDSNSVFALMSGHGGLSLRSIGDINHTLVESNYNPKAIEGYNHITECLGSEDPCGRLILLQGPPGVGKSYMIRSLVSSIKSTFIVVGSDMISSLTGPAILPVIMGCVNSEEKKPITFILEDADIALAHRKKGDVSHLSGLLNLGDGLLGELLDIRILATTNAEMLDLDPAITRPGRMCQHISLKPFSGKEAAALYNSMVPGKNMVMKHDRTLAEIYRMAREDGWVPETKDIHDGQYL